MIFGNIFIHHLSDFVPFTMPQFFHDPNQLTVLLLRELAFVDPSVNEIHPTLPTLTRCPLGLLSLFATLVEL